MFCCRGVIRAEKETSLHQRISSPKGSCTQQEPARRSRRRTVRVNSAQPLARSWIPIWCLTQARELRVALCQQETGSRVYDVRDAVLENDSRQVVLIGDVAVDEGLGVHAAARRTSLRHVGHMPRAACWCAVSLWNLHELQSTLTACACHDACRVGL
jgi:hypothetical protein